MGVHLLVFFRFADMAGLTLSGGRLNAFNSLEVDEIPPAAVDDLLASNPTLDSLTLTWTATGDNGYEGTAVFYDVRYSTSQINDGNWNDATRATGQPRPKESG